MSTIDHGAPSGIRVGANAAIVRNGAILLVKIDDASGPHFNLPGGGVEPGESMREAVSREVREETDADVDVGRLLLLVEYVPEKFDGRYGPVQKLGAVFECTLRDGSVPRLPDTPDANHVAVQWVPLDELSGVALLPQIADRLVEALASDFAIPLIERF